MSPAAKTDRPAAQRSAGKSRDDPNFETCELCRNRFETAIRRPTVTIALRATVIPMLLGTVALCLWLLISGVGPAQIFVSGMH